MPLAGYHGRRVTLDGRSRDGSCLLGEAQPRPDREGCCGCLSSDARGVVGGEIAFTVKTERPILQFLYERVIGCSTRVVGYGAYRATPLPMNEKATATKNNMFSPYKLVCSASYSFTRPLRLSVQSGRVQALCYVFGARFDRAAHTVWARSQEIDVQIQPIIVSQHTYGHLALHLFEPSIQDVMVSQLSNL